ncbi:LLM class flavin-dependent oxidoreductase [Phytohabitans houttuyneae]|uniref:N5,N10-methylene tetrahydromethanopterin reductase n=1 Tax=Phytohabitans houttuyneae TaxID=1076126 RepID=A0A6V8KFP0_9ACTN|nr:LLM class flavin-dependent oxidoreductase [Phytohabitans houttuyneae]GFJ81188.1 N5,N10-methylene tetrahydromethanopterin reductase [Phytohabitans houttuyneae]
MRYGAHLPLIDFEDQGWQPRALASYAAAARHLGYACVTANDHLVFQRPWLDGLVALAAVVEASGDLELATSVALPVVRGPVALAKAAAALDVVSGGRLVLGVGPGSSAHDYEAAGVPFGERWPRFEESIQVLRACLTDGAPFEGRFYAGGPPLRPRPPRVDGPPIWVASWGSDAGLRRVARLGDGWVASAYNTTPARIVDARAKLAAALERDGRSLDRFPCALATMWTYVTDDSRARDTRLAELAAMLNRPVEQLSGRVLVGPAESCAALVRRYAEAGVDRMFIWPLADAEVQLARFMRDVVPLV